MPVSDRSAPFFFSLDPKGRGWGGSKQDLKAIPINAFAPVEIENDHFKGRMMMFHETGSEPGMELYSWTEDADAGLPGERRKRGVELQIQGRFKKPCPPWTKSSGLWVCAELESPMKLGFLMQNVLKMIMAFVKKKSDGRFYYNLGTASEKPHLAFPLGQVFTCIETPPDKEPPKLGSSELAETKWQGPEGMELKPENTYTFFYKTPFADLCTWEVLGVPGVSPLGGEKLVGDVTKVRLLFYDSTKAGSHAACRDGAVLEFLCAKGNPGDRWAEPEPEAEDGQDVLTALAEESESSASERGEDVEEEGGDDEVVEEAVEAEDDESEDDEEPLEDEDKLSMAESMQLKQIEAWRPSHKMAVFLDSGGDITVPFYIEAIDRRRRFRLHVWYVFQAKSSETKEWWHTLAVPQLVPLCRKRPKMKRTFRRGRTAAMVKRYGAQSLEQFRHEMCKQLVHDEGTKLREAIVKAASSGFELQEIAESAELMAPQESPKTIKEVIAQRKRKQTLLPPRFCNGSFRACELAFAQAKDGRTNTLTEGVVGCIHFEGRMCEELLRVGKDGSIRLFAAYDCDKPRLKIPKGQLLAVKALPGIFLGRFHLFELHTELSVLTLCCSDAKDRDTWVSNIELLLDTADTLPAAGMKSGFVSNEQSAALLDNTRVQRWRPSRRLVMNDRRLLAMQTKDKQPQHEVAAFLLEQALALPDNPEQEELEKFLDATCILKAVNLSDLTQSQFFAFWLNVYHCLLLHARKVLGTPKSRRELTRFNTRVSYLVAFRPVSLHEIERSILRCPISDRVAVNAVSSTAQRGRSKVQLAASAIYSRMVFACCPSRVEELHAAEEARQAEVLEEDRERQDAVSAPSQQELTSPRPTSPRRPPNGGVSNRFLNPECFPIIQPSLPQIRRPFPEPPCLFLGYIPPRFRSHAKDRRMTLVLNRGNMESLKSIPIFSADILDKQITAVCKSFLVEYMQQKTSTLGQPVILLPHVCRGLHREMQRDRDAYLKFLGQYLPNEKKLNEKAQLAFRKYLGVPRKFGDLQRISYPPELEPPPFPPQDFTLYYYTRALPDPASLRRSESETSNQLSPSSPASPAPPDTGDKDMISL
mmetsp:Transcript_6055/g.13397  ORF Transcript_6055/g.13397 Transcript_6055/m.13397 type:complete len:1098 (+) Transcript_6055:76-3369(+)